MASAGALKKPELGKLESARYARQLSIEGFGARAQLRLKESRVFLAGAGGLGCTVGVFLALAGIGEIIVADSGRVELSNLNRQLLYREEDIGLPKAEVFAMRLRAMNPLCEIVAYDKEIDAASAFALMEGCDLAIDALDNFPSRLMVNDAALKRGIPLVHGAVDSFSGEALVVRPGSTGCLACLFGDRSTGGATPVIGAAVGLVASLQAELALKILAGLPGAEAGVLYFVNGDRLEIERIRIERKAGCPQCASIRP